jgi:hypothetical protein
MSKRANTSERADMKRIGASRIGGWSVHGRTRYTLMTHPERLFGMNSIISGAEIMRDQLMVYSLLSMMRHMITKKVKEGRKRIEKSPLISTDCINLMK